MDFSTLFELIWNGKPEISVAMEEVANFETPSPDPNSVLDSATALSIHKVNTQTAFCSSSSMAC